MFECNPAMEEEAQGHDLPASRLSRLPALQSGIFLRGDFQGQILPWLQTFL